jgi:membrane-associated phospholipid phosphatase
MRSAVLHRPVQAIRHLRTRLGLTLSGAVALGAGLAVLCLSTVAFGGVTEDVTRHNGLSTSDVLHLGWFTRHRSDLAIWVAHVLSDIGNVAALALIAVVAAVVLWRHGVRLAVAIAPGIALGIGGVAAAAGKSLVARGRPPVALHLVSESGASFPSGHATDSTALYVTLALVVAIFVFRRPIARWACVLGSAVLSGAIGVSRLVLGVHWPTDVLAGWALGLSVALVVTIAASIATRVAVQGPASPNRRTLTRVTDLMARRRRTRSLEAA